MIETEQGFDQFARRIYDSVSPAKKELQLDLTRFIAEEKIKQIYPQNWWAYNEAQTREKLLFHKILQELCEAAIPFQEKRKVGRPGLSKREKVFCMGLYCYGCFSSRRSISDLEIGKKIGLITHVPHFNSILNYFSDKSLTALISQLIELSAIPLKVVEKDFAVDSTGFSTSRYETWFNIRTQKKSKKRMWKKAHLMIGTKTNIITSLIITDGVVGDCPYLIPLVKKTKTYFDMEAISADKAYSSRDNLRAISEAGAYPFIPFKSNASPKSRGCIVWAQMYKFFTKNRQEFEKRYHKRSNVESTNSMIKRKFSNHIKTKKHTAQTNEILMKCLCHNICVLIQEAFEQGIEIDLNSCAKTYFAQK